MPTLFVTGAGKGIGRAIVERFFAGGWEVAGLTRSAEDVAALGTLGREARFWRGDAADAEAVGRVAAALSGSAAGRPPREQRRRLRPWRLSRDRARDA